jgi:hypothetical protein
MYKLILCLLVILLVGCATNKFTGKASGKYEELTCTLKEKPCRINYGDVGHISYSVEEIGFNKYKVKGSVDLNMKVVGGMQAKTSFYVLFMDDNFVQLERKVKTGTRKATFEFEVETQKTIKKSTVQNVLFHTRS